MRRVRTRFPVLVALAFLAWPRISSAQSTATAAATARILEPIGISAATPGSNFLSPVPAGTGLAQLSGGGFRIQGPANQVVSVSVTLPSSVQRVGGGAALPVAAATVRGVGMLTADGTAGVTVAGAAPLGGAAGGVYAGVAEVLVNLN